jgi:hypothetical protein
MHSQRDTAVRRPADPDPGSITDVRDSSGPGDAPVRFAATSSVSWLTAVVAVAAFAAGILLSSTLLPERQGAGAGLAASTPSTMTPAPTSPASPSPAPRPTVHEIVTDAQLEATLPDTFEGHLLTKRSMTGAYARNASDLTVRLMRIAELAGGELWSYASASLDPWLWGGPQVSIEALIVTGSPIGDLLEAYASYSLEMPPAFDDGVSCDIISVEERRIARCGAWVPGWWVEYWDGTYAYANGVTLYVINGIGSIEDDPVNLRLLETILGQLP